MKNKIKTITIVWKEKGINKTLSTDEHGIASEKFINLIYDRLIADEYNKKSEAQVDNAFMLMMDSMCKGEESFSVVIDDMPTNKDRFDELIRKAINDDN